MNAIEASVHCPSRYRPSLGPMHSKHRTGSPAPRFHKADNKLAQDRALRRSLHETRKELLMERRPTLPRTQHRTLECEPCPYGWLDTAFLHPVGCCSTRRSVRDREGEAPAEPRRSAWGTYQGRPKPAKSGHPPSAIGTPSVSKRAAEAAYLAAGGRPLPGAAKTGQNRPQRLAPTFNLATRNLQTGPGAGGSRAAQYNGVRTRCE
jgi:hypothetical protein